MGILEKAHHGMKKATEYANKGHEAMEKAKKEGREFKKEFQGFGDAMRGPEKKRPKSLLDD